MGDEECAPSRLYTPITYHSSLITSSVGAEDAPAHRAAKNRREVPARREEMIEIHAAAPTHAIAQIDEILRRQVPGRAGGEWAPAQPCTRRVEAGNTQRHRSHRARERRSSRVMQMHYTTSGPALTRPAISSDS